MRCPSCGHLEDRVIDSRSTKEGRAIRRRRDVQDGAIAVVGMSGRFPGARNVRGFWANILAGRGGRTHFDVAELEHSFDDGSRREDR